MDLSRLFNQILPQASAFLGVFFVVMMIGYGFLYFVDFVPEEPKASEAVTEEEEIVEEVENPENDAPSPVEPAVSEFRDPLPKSITLGPLGRTVTVLNPNSRSVANLDAALLKGVVRHPDSADLLDPYGNILILGHSSYLKTVFNKNFQAFNGIQNLKWGDTITLRSSEAEYTYRVERVYEAKASAVMIPTKSSQAKLTLATCDTFGAKEDRFIVEAVLVSKKAL
jgi:LPXTG-site transpeptidase (sortase) family protein